MGLGDGLDDRQAEAEALTVAGAVGGEPLEGLQQPVHGGRRDHGPGVDHRQDGAGVPGAGDDLDVAAGHVVRQRVVGEVGDQAFGQPRVAGGAGRGEGAVDGELPVLCAGLPGAQDVAGQRGEVEGFPFVQAGLAAGQGEQRFEDP